MAINIYTGDGNAFAILGFAREYLKTAGQLEAWECVQERATSGDYNNLLTVCEEATGFSFAAYYE
jgi:hypothetical protein